MKIKMQAPHAASYRGSDKNVPQYEEWIRMYYGRWEEMLGGPIEKTVEVLDQLLKNLNTGLLL